MQWTVKVTVALLNVAWIAFFLHPDPFSVSVQRRSSGEEMLFGEFCIHSPSKVNWTSTPPSVNISSNKTNESNTTAEGRKESNFTLYDVQSVNKTRLQHDCHCNITNNLSQLVDIKIKPPGCENKIIMVFPTKELCIDEETFYSFFAPSAVVPASTESTPLNKSETPNRAPAEREYLQPGPDRCCFEYFPNRQNKNLISSYVVTDERCQKPAVILVTKKGHHICVDPNLYWVVSIRKSLDGVF